MTARRLLAAPLLSPLLAVLLVAALNPGPRLSFRLLTWTTPGAPLGLWLGGAALGGAALSGAGTALALRQGQAVVSRRRRVSSRFSRSSVQSGSRGDQDWEREADESFPTPASWREPAPQEATRPGRAAAVAVPPRSPGEPAPTVDVPYRVLQRPDSRRPAAREREPVPVGGEDDWGQQASGEDW